MFTAYEQVLSKEEQTSAILSAVAMVAFSQSDYNKCKTLLFKAYVLKWRFGHTSKLAPNVTLSLLSSFQTPPPSLHGLVSLSVLGYLGSDLTLIMAALQEIAKIVGEPFISPDIPPPVMLHTAD